MRKFLIAIFAAFQLFWFGVYVPGHVRGAITFDGPPSQSGKKASSCCASEHPGSTPQQPSSNDRAHCVVCYFVAGLSTPPPVDVVPGLQHSLVLPAEPRPRWVWVEPMALAFDATAPPIEA